MNFDLQEGGAKEGGKKYYVVTKTSSGKTGGRYSSLNGPAAAAKKAASKRFGTKNSITITVKQTGVKNIKEFTYEATRTKLRNPVERTINGKTIKYLYNVEVKAV